MHQNSILMFERHVLPLISDGLDVLEIAPDATPSSYQRLVTADVRWTTTDLASERTHEGVRRWGTGDTTMLMTDPYQIPADDDSFDVVLSGQVIEHVRAPWRWMAELVRVCRPGGRVITVSPVSWPYHEAPVDCWRIYPEGMRALCEEAGAEVELALWESLEKRPRRWYPGPSNEQDLGWKGRLRVRGLGLVGWPLPVAFDAVTVARKPA